MNDITMNPLYDALCGITEEELYCVFEEPIQQMAKIFESSEADIKYELKRTYDGYHFSSGMTDIYNPFSIINTFSDMRLDDYWFRSGTPTYLVKLLEGHQVSLQKLTEDYYESAYFIDYRADSEDPLAMLYQSGYLTIKQYDRKYNRYRLDFPNDEVRKGFISLIATRYLKIREQKVDSWIIKLDQMLQQCDLDGIRDAYTSFLSSIPYTANKDERASDFESHYQYTFYLINRMLGSYSTLIEKQNSGGRSDIIIETENDVFIFEFKLDASAKDALSQIEEKQYALPYLNDPRKLHKIGVNISSKTRTVEEWISE